MLHLSFFVGERRMNRMASLNDYVHALIDIAKSNDLHVENVEIKWVKDSTIKKLVHQGYENRPNVIASFDKEPSSSSFYPEIFIIGNPHTIYLNKENDFELNLLSIAHGLAHADFVNRNDILKRLKGLKQRIDNELIPYINNLLQREDIAHIKTFLNHLKQISFYTWSPVHHFIFQLENKLYSHYLGNNVVKNLTESVAENLSLYETVIKRANHLKTWEKDLARLLALEAIYFYGIHKHKLINEGWATFWQLKLVQQLPLKND